MESTSQLRCVLVCQFTVSFPTSELCYKCFSYNDIFFMTLGLYSFVVRPITYGNNIWKFCFLFVRHCGVFFISSQLVIYLFDVVTIFVDVRISLYFGTFKLRMEMTWKLRFMFFRHCDVFFITSQWRYLFVRCSYVFYCR